MKLEQIHAEWNIDSKIDALNLNNEASKGHTLHSKYWQILSSERIKLTILEIELKKLKSDKQWFFMHGFDEYSISKKWELPPQGKIFSKEEAKSLVDIDQEIIDNTIKVAIHKEKCLLLESIINSINQRTFTIKNMIAWRIFENGG